MYLQRNIDQELTNWANAENRKPILLRGARQVGKTLSIRNLSQSFEHYIELNLDENESHKSIFEKFTDINEICQVITAIFDIPIIDGKTLLFIDEIQSCLPAISAIRYFYEKRPDLHLITSGSLLEFALAELPSFGVGRVRSVFMYPFSFDEFLRVSNKSLYKTLLEHNINNPINDLIHHELLKIFQYFLVIGGMPEVVKAYIKNSDLQEVQKIQYDILLSLEDDFSKYKTKVTSLRIREIFNEVAIQTGNKFSFTNLNRSFNNLQIKESLELLRMAGWIIPITHSAANGIPLGAELNLKKRKYLIIDSGLYQRMLGLPIGDILLGDTIEFINKGAIAELLVGLELIKNDSCYERKELYYWVREARNSQAEVDYLIQKSNIIIPIEVKAGKSGSMQSIHLFMQEKKSDYGIRMSLENFGEIGKIKIFPAYAVSKLYRE